MANWPSPLPLITCRHGKFKVKQETVSNLQKIRKPLVVVCIAGIYRTGKSYLMNRLVGKPTGFALGNTVESKTKEIWVWYINHPKDSSKGLLVMDTEGLDDAMKGDADNDMHILTLSILLSSIFIYNVMGKLDNSAIDMMDFVTEISKHIQVKTNSRTSKLNDSSFECIFPHFVLVCRDAILALEMEGKAITADEYLDRIMLGGNRRSTRDRDIKRNEIKEKLRRYFTHRKCFFLPRPAKEDEDMKRLEYLAEKDLKLTFLTESNAFCSYIHKNAPVKKLDSLPVTGKIFVHLVQSYADAINNGTIPCIGTALELVSTSENSTLLDECIDEYKTLMSQVKLPISTSQLAYFNRKHNKTVMEYFANNVFLDENNKYHRKLKIHLQTQYAEYEKKNCRKIEKDCNKMLEELYEPIRERMNNGDYFEIDGYDDFTTDCEELEEKYESTTWNEEVANTALSKFRIQIKNDGKIIFQTERKLRETERKQREQRRLRKEAEQERERQREEIRQQKQRQKALIKAQEEEMRARKEKIAAEEAAWRRRQEEAEQERRRQAEECRRQEEAEEEERERRRTEIESFERLSIPGGILGLMIPGLRRDRDVPECVLS